MKKSRQELDRIHKEKCRELREIRAVMAEDLGIELNQKECTYEGYCSGTCPKCKSEELKINAALVKRQMEESDLKRKIAAAGLTTVAALSLSGCGNSIGLVDGGVEPVPYEEIYGTEECDTEECETEERVIELEGDVAINTEDAE